MLVYKSEPHSYRDLPLRMGELGLVHRHELSGALHGLFRVRCFTQDDAHIFMTPDQMKDEIKDVVEAVRRGLLHVRPDVSDRAVHHAGGPHRRREGLGHCRRDARRPPSTELGKDYVSQRGRRRVLRPEARLPSGRLAWDAPGSAAPSSSTIQLPERFELEYTGEDGAETPPRHDPPRGASARSSASSAFITEHFAGAFPAWLTPGAGRRSCPSTDRAHDYAAKLAAQLDAQGCRVEVDARNEKIGKKIREAQLEKVPYMLIVGDRDIENGTVSPRHRAEGDPGCDEHRRLHRHPQGGCGRRAPQVNKKQRAPRRARRGAICVIGERLTPWGEAVRRSRLMKGRPAVYELRRVLTAPKPPLGDQGEVARRSRDGRDEKG